MAHRIILGKFGSGKSLYGVHLVVQELLNSDRPIVTTLALKLPELNEFVQRLKPNRDCRVYQRVLVIGKQEIKKFWRYRGVERLGEYGVEPIIWGPCGDSSSTTKNPVVPDPRWEAVTQGVAYFIDEAPVGFHARKWAETGIEFSDFITQHRKLSSDVWTFARHSGLLDKQFRDTADSCIILDNWYTRMIKVFTAPRKIKVKHYENCPPDRGEDPAKSEDLHIDPSGLAACYDTAKGLGVAGTSADIGKRSKGIPVYAALACAPFVGLLAWVAIHYFLRFGTSSADKLLSVAHPSAAAHAVTGLLAPQLAQLDGSGARVPLHPFVEPPRMVPAAVPPPIFTQEAYWGSCVLNHRLFLHTPAGILEVFATNHVGTSYYDAKGVHWHYERGPDYERDHALPLHSPH